MRPEQAAAITARAKWKATARPDQITPEGDWSTWVILAGRGWGKTRTGAEDAAWAGLSNPGWRIAVVAPTSADARDTCIEGDSGLINVLPREAVQTWNRSLGELILVNGTRYKTFSADEPERLRGPQHHRAWADELAAWRYPEAWDQLMFGLRLGQHPQAVVTTTPKPTPLVKSLVASPSSRVTRGSTFDNAANLAPSALAMLKAKYEGTRLGRQELDAEILGDLPGALWSMASLDAYRLREAPPMGRIVVAVDPAVTATESSDEHGIIVAGLSEQRGIVLEDASLQGSPNEWARRAVSLYRSWGADAIVIEVNQGGDMVAHTIRTIDPNVKIKEVRASRGKHVRAEPIAALYEQGRVAHVGAFPALENQMTQMTTSGFEGEGSPDRVDALVWALTDLFPGMTQPKLDPERFAIPKARGWMR
jgi:phage terminase large subunit-like protein